jgi:hypothetical protein
MKPVNYVVPVAVVLLSSCSWVEPTKESDAVAVVTDAVKLEGCKKLLSTTSSVLDKVGFMDRTERAMADELTILAKNKAAAVGGDTVIAKGPVKDGSMSFDIFKCGE